MAFCQDCGVQVDDAAAFCPFCGAAQATTLQDAVPPANPASHQQPVFVQMRAPAATSSLKRGSSESWVAPIVGLLIGILALGAFAYFVAWPAYNDYKDKAARDYRNALARAAARAPAVQSGTAPDPGFDNAETYTDEAGVRYRITRDSSGALLQAPTFIITLGKNCDAFSPQYGGGKWGHTSDGTSIVLSDGNQIGTQINFANQHLDVAEDATCALVLDDFRLTLAGLGPLRIGMSEQEVKSAGFELSPPKYQDIEDCSQVFIIGRKDIGLMFVSNKLARVEIYESTIQTRSGIRVGDTEAMAFRTYGNEMKTEPHTYDEAGHYLIVTAKNSLSSLVLETDGNRITEMRAGPAAQAVEGCL